MSKSQRIPVEAIQAMKKTLDALPDKNLDKTKEEALAMLNGQIQRAYTKGYSIKELAVILSEGKVTVSAPTLRAHTCPSSPRAKKEKPVTTTEVAASKKATANMATHKTIPAQQEEDKDMPSSYKPDLPDSEL
jgi:flagellar capping protein FliD